MIKVLDHGFVHLVDSMGSDLSVVRAARVSYNASWRAGSDTGSDKRLINYLWRNSHTTPFEAVTFTFEVKAPIFVIRQWHRHRTWSYNEVSARYTELPEEFYTPDPQNIGHQSKDNKQGRTLGVHVHDVDGYVAACNNAFDLYNMLLNEKWPRELARMVLPLSTYTHMFATVNLLNCLKFLSLRCDAHSQWEIQQYAYAVAGLIRPVVPVCYEAWENKLG